MMSIGLSQDIIDFDEIEEIASEVEHKQEHKGKQRAIQEVHKCPKKWPCEGFLVIFPEGANHHTSYLFGIHSEQSVPWNYHSIDNKFYLQAKSCQKVTSTEGEACENC